MVAASVTYTNWRPISDQFAYTDETRGARGVLEWAYGSYVEEELVYASSFGAEAIVLIDLIQQIKQDARIVFWIRGCIFPKLMKSLIGSKAGSPGCALNANFRS